MGGSQCEAVLRAPGFLWGRGCRSFFSSLSQLVRPLAIILSPYLCTLANPQHFHFLSRQDESLAHPTSVSLNICLCLLRVSLRYSVSVFSVSLLSHSFSLCVCTSDFVSFCLCKFPSVSHCVSISWFFLSLSFCSFLSCCISLSSSLLFLLPSPFHPHPSLFLNLFEAQRLGSVPKRNGLIFQEK